MLFNSIEFLLFFVPLFALYYFVLMGRARAQNVLLLAASYVFYAWADWRILPLLIATTLVFYGLGIAIGNAKTDKAKSRLTWIGAVAGLGALGYFKYTNFFIESFRDLFDAIGLQSNLHTFKIIVPVGISFYTFRLLSYLFDLNRGKYEPTRDIVAFSSYVAFFPCILSGPIDRPNTLLPQLHSARLFSYNTVVSGLRILLFGLFKKMVIADHCASVANGIFENYATASSPTLLLGALLYAFQMYADFSGYTDMAIGVARVLGLEVTKNFNRPYLAQNIADFWRRWHISLTSWLTDYVYMPLNVRWRNWGKWGMILAIVIDFAICGFWHGANWTYLAWGFYHGLLFVPLILSGAMFKKTKLTTAKFNLPTLSSLGRMLLTFCLVALGLIVFRAESMAQGVGYLARAFSFSAEPATYSIANLRECNFALLLIAVLMVYEYVMETKGAFWTKIFERFARVRWAIYLTLALSIIYLGVYGAGNDNNFIYFKF